MHHTKDKGDLAVAKVTLDLISKQYEVCSPVFSEHYKYDLIAVKNNKMFRIQCKYSKDGLINPKTSWADKNGNYSNYYLDTDFEYYGVYLPNKDVVIYPSISFKGSIIKTEIPNSNIEFYWYLDFLDFTDNASKKTCKDFNKINIHPAKNKPNFLNRKINRPTKEYLHFLLWSETAIKIAKRFKVSDRCINNWAKDFKLSKPNKGYWEKHIIDFSI